MKKLLLMFALVAIVGLSSCTSISSTAYTEAVNTGIYNRSYANLEVGDKVVSYTLQCNWAQSRSGMNSCKAAAVQECLRSNGGGDVLVNPQYEVKSKRSIFGKKIQYVKVTGRIGKYKDIRPISEKEAEIVKTLKVKK